MNSDYITAAEAAELPLPWLAAGDDSEVVLATCLEMARNLRTSPFPRAAGAEDKKRVRNLLAEHVNRHLGAAGRWLEAGGRTVLAGELLSERWAAAVDFPNDSSSLNVWFGNDNRTTILINHEEHLHVRLFSSGLALEESFRRAEAITKELECRLPIAFSHTNGYLTSCPAKQQAGMRISSWLHLPGMAIMGEIEALERASEALNLELAGAFGQGTGATGQFLEISMSSQGILSAEQLALRWGQLVHQLIRGEKLARLKVYRQRRDWLNDMIGRAYGILRHGRRLSAREMFRCLSFLRLGIVNSMFSRLRLEHTEELPVRAGSAHLRAVASASTDEAGLNAQEINRLRSDFIRAALLKSTSG